MQEVILHHKDEFRQLLAQYQPSDEAKQLLAAMPLVLLQGITGSGRNSIITYLVEHMSYHQIVSDTTRPPKIRDGKMEENGVAYFFRSEEEVLADLRKGMFLEAELIHDQQVSGISIRELERAYKSNKTPINEVAREGVENIRRAKPDTMVFFVVPPSYDEWIRRLKGREQMTPEEFNNRKNSAILELQEALEAGHFTFVINETLEQSANDIIETRENGINQDKQQAGRAAAQEILAALHAN